MQVGDAAKILTEANSSGGMEGFLVALLGILSTFTAAYIWVTNARSAKLQDASSELAVKAVSVAEALTVTLGGLRLELAEVRAELSQVRVDLAKWGGPK